MNTLEKRRVVISGMGCVAPNGLDTESFWSGIEKGISGLGTVTLFPVDPFPCKIAGELKEFDIFQHITPKKAREVHRVVPIALAAAREALYNAGIDSNSTEKERLSVIIGTGANGLSFYEQQAVNLDRFGLKKVTPHTITATFAGMLSSEISMANHLHGTSQVISNDCTSASDAMGYAFNMIRFGMTDMVLTGGAESSLSPLIFASFSRMGALSTHFNDEPQRASRPFNQDRDGFIFAEGGWMFVMEELEHARSRGATIYGEIKGYGSTNDAYHKTSPESSGTYLAKAIELALQDGGLNKDDIDYISLHGTSTPVNDRVESMAIKRCFGEKAYEIPMSSLKSSVGHPQGASGALGVAGTLLAMRHNTIPPTINYENPDPDCDLDYVPNESREAVLNHCLVNSVGFGSKNSILAIARYQE